MMIWESEPTGREPYWAEIEFCRRAGLDHHHWFRSGQDDGSMAVRFAVREGAKLIAEHEGAPPDLVEVAADEIVDAWLDDGGDTASQRELVARGIHRGIKMASEMHSECTSEGISEPSILQGLDRVISILERARMTLEPRAALDDTIADGLTDVTQALDAARHLTQGIQP